MIYWLNRISAFSGYLLENNEYIMKRTIRLTESDLHRVIMESVLCTLNEWPGADALVKQQQQDLIDQCSLEIFCYADGSIDDDTTDDGRDCVPVMLIPVFDEDFYEVVDVEFEIEWNYRTPGMPKQYLDERIMDYISKNKESIIDMMDSCM